MKECKERFNVPDGGSQNGEFISSSLDPEEEKLVEHIIQWKNVSAVIPLLRDVHGRSFIFQSPTRVCTSRDYLQGNYDGLQVIGAGGNIEAIVEGIRRQQKKITISPVDERNHAKELFQILQLRNIDNNGILQLWQRPYAPLHGMDQTEATNRKRMTNRLRVLLGTETVTGSTRMFNVPELAAEGIFLDKRDESDVPLCFQVYRVPILRRFPGQLLDTCVVDGIAVSFPIVQDYSFYIGMALDFFADESIAYMDYHLGNTSFIQYHNKQSVYLTDLGSIQDYRDSQHKNKYRGFDIYSFICSADKFATALSGHYKDSLNSTIHVHSSLVYCCIYGLLGGMKRNIALKNNIKLSRLEAINNVDLDAEQLYEVFRTHESPQNFLDSFESFYQDFLDRHC